MLLKAFSLLRAPADRMNREVDFLKLLVTSRYLKKHLLTSKVWKASSPGPKGAGQNVGTGTKKIL